MRRGRRELHGVDLAWFTTRERDGDEVLPWDHLDSGLDKQWLWDDWQDALGEFEQDDCRWTPCFDCGVCSNLGTDIQIGPTGRSLLPLPAVRLMAGAASPEGPPPPPVVQRLRMRYAKRGRLRFTSHRDFARAFERALRRAECRWPTRPGSRRTRRSATSARPRPAWPARPSTSRSGWPARSRPEQVRAALDAALPDGLDIVEVVRRRARLAGRPDAGLALAHRAARRRAAEQAGDALAALLARERGRRRAADQGRPPARWTSRGADRLVAVVARARVGHARQPSRAILDLVVRQVTPAVRPDDVLAALRIVAGLALAVPPVAVRVAQGPLDEHGAVSDPLAPDRATARTAP